MGAWGFGITDNDTTADIVETFEELLKTGIDLAKASRQTLNHPDWADVRDDPDVAALIWLGLAHVEWKYGALAPKTLKRVTADFEAGRGLGNWTEPSRRRRAVEAFIAKISKPNSKPKPLPKPATRKRRYRPAGYEAGDCLAVRLHDGRFGAAYVVATHSPDDAHGSNAVLELDYLGKRAPTLEEFKSMKPLRLTHGAWKRELWLTAYPARNGESDSLAEVVGNRKLRYPGADVEFVAGYWVNWARKPDADTLFFYKSAGKPIRKNDPGLHSMRYGAWDLGAQRLLQDKHDRKK